MHVAHLNINSLRHKLDEVSKLLHDFEIDVFGLSETKLDDDVDDAELTIPCYRLFRKDRNKSGGGVAMYVSSRLHVQRFCDPDRDDIEAFWLKLFLRREVYRIGVVYRPRSEFVDYWNKLCFSWDALSTTNTIIIRDFNANPLNSSDLAWKHLNFISLSYGVKNCIRVAYKNYAL